VQCDTDNSLTFSIKQRNTTGSKSFSDEQDRNQLKFSGWGGKIIASSFVAPNN